MSDDAQAQVDEPGREQAAGGEQRPARISPGHLLRSAREEKGLSVDELVSQTLLSRTTVEALEDNAFDRLSQPVFVRGYYRKCAKVLGLSEEEVMTAYAEWTGVTGPSPASPGQVDVVPQDVTPGNARFFGFLLVVLAIAAVIAALWLFLPILRDRLGGDSAGGGDTSGGVEVTSLLSRDETSSAGQPQPAPETAADQQTDTSSPAPAASGADNAGAEPPAAATPALRLRFKERSWVEVRDASGRRLLNGIVGAGKQRTVEGEPPYHVALGNAPGVEVYAAGRRVNIDNETESDNTARFTVGGQSGQ